MLPKITVKPKNKQVQMKPRTDKMSKRSKDQAIAGIKQDVKQKNDLQVLASSQSEDALVRQKCQYHGQRKFSVMFRVKLKDNGHQSN